VTPPPRDELVEVLDDDGHVVAVVPRRRVRAENLLHRSVYLLVTGTDGRLLVHRRADGKDLWPGRWDLAAGGVVTAGESWDEAARRELAEELGVAAEPVALGPGRYDGDDCRVEARVYRVVSDGPFTFADGEVVATAWADAAELARRLGRDPFVPDSPVVCRPWLPPLPPVRS
jgi:isopentenyldiphosphate isomerase